MIPARDLPWKLCRVALLTALLFGAGANELLEPSRVLWFRGLHSLATATTYAHLVAGVFRDSEPAWPRRPVRFGRATDARLFVAQLHLVEGYVIFLAAWLLHYILPKPVEQAGRIADLSEGFFRSVPGSLVHGLLFLEVWWGAGFDAPRRPGEPRVEQHLRMKELPAVSDWTALKEFARTWEFAAALSAVALATLFFAMVFTSLIDYQWLEHFLITMIVITVGIDGYLAMSARSDGRVVAPGASDTLPGQPSKRSKLHAKNK